MSLYECNAHIYIVRCAYAWRWIEIGERKELNRVCRFLYICVVWYFFSLLSHFFVFFVCFLFSNYSSVHAETKTIEELVMVIEWGFTMFHIISRKKGIFDHSIFCITAQTETFSLPHISSLDLVLCTGKTEALRMEDVISIITPSHAHSSNT